MVSRQGSRAVSVCSQRSERLQEIKDASEEVRRVTRQRAKVAAEKKKLEAEHAAEEAKQALSRQERQAEMDAEMEMIEADNQHALRILEAVSEPFGSTNAGSAWGDERNHEEEEAAERTSQWAEKHTTAVQKIEQPRMEKRREEVPRADTPAGDCRESREALHGEAPGEEQRANAARAATGVAARVAAAADADLEETRAGGTRRVDAESAAAEAAARTAPEATSSSREGVSEDPSEKLIQQVSRIFSVAAIKPHYNLELPSFSGDPLQFIAFKSIFAQSTELMHLSDSQNLLRLQTALKGRARESVSGLLMSPANVSEIMKALELLFGNPNVIIQRTLAEVRKIKDLKESVDAEELLKYACQVKNLVATVRSLNKPQHLWNPDLLTSLVAKLPKNMLTLWLGEKKSTGQTDPVIVYFAEWLEELAVRAQEAGLSTTEPGRKYQENTRERKYRETPRKNFVLNTHGKNTNKCLYCAGEHYFSKCGKMKNLPVIDRWDTVKKLGVCFKCLSPNDARNSCPIYKRFPKNKFHFLLAGERADVEDKGAVESEDAPSTADGRAVVTHTITGSRVFLQVIRITVVGPKGKKRIHALLDNGSTVSLLDQSVAKELGICGVRQSVEVSGVRGMKVMNHDAEVVNFRIKGALSKKYYDIHAYSVNYLNLPELKCFSGDGVKHAMLEAYDSKSVENVLPQLLIGADCGELILSRNITRVSGDLHLAQTRLGWVPVGKMKIDRERDSHFSFCTDGQIGDSSLNILLEENLKLEQQWPGKKREIAGVRRAEELLSATTSVDNRVWTTGLLWKDEQREVPDSRPMALARLKSVEKRMDKDIEYGKTYCARMNQYLEAGYAEEVLPESLQGRKDMWYLPHMGITHPAKPGKIRIVHDAAAKVRGVSLNTLLLAGPDYFNSIVGILMRFREHPVGFTADISDMFLRIKIRESDSFKQLFFWRGLRRDVEPKVYKMNSLIFGSKFSPTSAQYVRNMNAERYRDRFPDAVDAIVRHHYMDDLLFGAATVKEARQVIKEIIWIHKQGNFFLTGWGSNSVTALDDIPADKKSKNCIEIEKGELSSQRLLGLQWVPEHDEFAFNLKMEKIDEDLKAGARAPTKREALKVIMSIWDPNGFLSPICIRAKVIMQLIWSSGISWDQPVAPEIFESWKDWLKVLHTALYVRIPRYIGTTKNLTEHRELHVFCDASQKAMCGVAYMRIERKGERPSVSFIASKTRVGLLKGLSIPRMELTAALLGAELATKIISEHAIEIHEKILWTDSTNVLWWIRSTSNAHQQFVSNRLGVLDDLTSPSE